MELYVNEKLAAKWEQCIENYGEEVLGQLLIEFREHLPDAHAKKA